ncbi:MAG TPA: FUSC family protein, partial [Bradyrhizobium sp.]|nr:FUSC family protein [Bradyrhizobium sp.]
MNQPPSFWARHAASVFALRTFAAAMLALSIALWLDMPRPYWAMTSVYITSNPLTGATGSKAVYRMLGTLIGAAGTIALVPNLVNAPELLSLAIALWVGVFLYFSLIDGTPRAYVFMLSGYTVALLGFPIISSPELTFDIVSSRVQEIMLGIVCASVVAMLVMPQSVASAISAKADAWLADARRLGIDVLSGGGSDQERDNQRMRLAAASAEIDQLSRHLDYEAATSANMARGLQRLRQHMLALLPLLGSIEDRRGALDSDEEASARIAAISARIARWLEAGARDGQQADSLRAALDEIRPTLDADAGWIDITLAGLVVRLRDLVDVAQDCRCLRDAIANGRNPGELKLAFNSDTLTVAVPHRDQGLALWAAAATALSVLACCAFWILTGWADGASAALFAAVAGSFLAGLDDPRPAFRTFGVVILVVIAISAIYTFGVLPRVTTIEMLIAALAPAFLLFGWMEARPATARAGAWFAVFTSAQLALQSSYVGSFASFTNASAALFIGVALTAMTCGIARGLGTGWIASRLLRSNWKTLAAVAERTSPADRVAIASLMQHRLALLAARISVVPAEAERDAANLRQLRTALSIIHLRQARLSRHAMAAIDALLGR